jgi:hypothetical protein
MPARPPSSRAIAGLTIVLTLSSLMAGCGGATGSAANSVPTSPPTSPSVAGSVVPGGSTDGAEAALLAGMRLDLAGACQPLRQDLPAKALAALSCRSTDQLVAGLQVYLFDTEDDVLAAYLAIVAARGITLRTSLDSLSIAEGAYTPGDDPTAPMIAERHAWWLDDGGNARYLAIEPPFVLIAVTGTNGDVNSLYRWAWRGNQDVPGNPTVWTQGHPADPSGKR